jgi:hypothetical protein
MDTLKELRLNHPIEVRRAFGADTELRAVPGQILEAHAGRAVVALITGARIVVALADPRDMFPLRPLRRPDLTRCQGRALALVNARPSVDPGDTKRRQAHDHAYRQLGLREENDHLRLGQRCGLRCRRPRLGPTGKKTVNEGVRLMAVGLSADKINA